MKDRFRTRNTMVPANSVILERHSDWNGDCTTQYPDYRAVSVHADVVHVGKIERMYDRVLSKTELATKSTHVNPLHVQVDEVAVLDVGDGPHFRSVAEYCLGINPQHVHHRYTPGAIAYFVPRDAASSTLPAMPNDLINDVEAMRMRTVAATRVQAKRNTNENLYEGVAELGKSTLMIRDLFTSMRRSFLRPTGKLKRAISLGDPYLVWRYGLSPFANDLVSVGSASLSTLGHINYRTKAREEATLQSTSIVEVPDALCPFGRIYLKVLFTDHLAVKPFSWDKAEFDLIKQVGLNLSALSSVAWELMPYSFVVDWFANIGDFIYANSPSGGRVNIAQGTIETRRRTVLYEAMGVTPNADRVLTAPFSGRLIRSLKEVNRSPNLGAAEVSFRRSIGEMNLWHVADSCALIAQALSRR